MTDQYSVLLKVPTGNAAFITESIFHFLVIYNTQYKGFPKIQSQNHCQLNKWIYKKSCPNKNLFKKNIYSLCFWV